MQIQTKKKKFVRKIIEKIMFLIGPKVFTQLSLRLSWVFHCIIFKEVEILFYLITIKINSIKVEF